MPELSYVNPSDTITSNLQNDIIDRVINRYDDPATRDSENASPTDGDIAFLEDVGSLQVYFSGSWRGVVPPGAVMAYAGSAAPAGWLICNGATVLRADYPALDAVMSAASYPYGNGDGSTTFEIPDLRGRFILHKASSGTGSTLGGTGGSLDHTHTGPSHTHTMGTHSHGDGSLSTNTTGAHNHTATTGSAGSHNHSFSDSFTTGGASATSSRESGSFSSVTSAHTHSGSVSGTTGSGGSHSHSITTAGDHSHTITGSTSSVDPGNTNAAGTGATGTNNPPFMAMFYMVKT